MKCNYCGIDTMNMEWITAKDHWKYRIPCCEICGTLSKMETTNNTAPRMTK